MLRQFPPPRIIIANGQSNSAVPLSVPPLQVRKLGKRGHNDEDAPKGLKKLKIVESLYDTIHGDPSERYYGIHQIRLDSHGVIAWDKETSGSVIIKRLRGPDARTKWEMLKKVRHEAFIASLKCYFFKDTYYAVQERFDVSVTLEHLLRRLHKPLEESEIALILQRVM
jgi:serine/threonine protein kinase